MQSTLDFGFINIHYYSIILLIAFICAFLVIYKIAIKKGFSKDFIENLLFGVFIAGIIGARIYYVIFNSNYYLSNPLEILMVWNGGLAIHGGIIFGLLFTIYYCHKKDVEVLKILDIMVIGLILGQAIGRWGNFFNGEAHGPVTTLNHLHDLHIPSFVISGMNIDGSYYIPTFFFESLFCLLGCVILYCFYNINHENNGMTVGIYLIYYSIVRFFIESFRTDSLMFFNLKVAQVISIVMIIIGVYLVFKNYFRRKKYERN